MSVLNMTDTSGNTALHWATKKRQVESVKLLLSGGANPNILNSSMMSPLHLAVQCLHNEIVKILAEHMSTDINLEGESGNTPILVACYKDNPEALKILIENGGLINKANNLGCMPVHAAAFSGAKLCLEIIIKKGEELGYTPENHINFTNNGKCSPIHLAVQSGDLEMIKMCIEYGAKVDLKQSDKCTALHFAATQGATNILKLMMTSYKGDEPIIDALDGNKETLLHRAALFDHYELAEYLISMMENIKDLVTDEDNEGCTPLHYACRQGVPLSVNSLLGLNVAISSKSRDKKSCLHFAASYGRINTCQRLLRDMEDTRLLNEGDKKGMTPLHLAAQNGHEKVTQFLLKKGALFLRDYKGWTALHHAAFGGYTRTMRIILDTNVKCTDNVDEDGLILDNCVVESCEEKTSRDFSIEYNFRYLQCPLKLAKQWKQGNEIKEGSDELYEPLVTLNAMVRNNRVELLTHPVCTEYLLMKWMAYGFRAHLMNLSVYCLGLIPLTLLITQLEPQASFNATRILGPFDKKNSYFITVCMCSVLIMSLFGIGKEILQLFQQKLRYLLDYSNLLDWTIYTTSIIFVSSLIGKVPPHLQWECGAVAIFLSWMNFLLYLQRFETYGIYVVMFWEILRTLIRITVVFFFLMLAFGLSFHVLLGTQRTYSLPYLSVMQTFAMMLGDINYREAFLEPLMDNTLPYPFLSYIILVIFTLLIPILLMNLLIGLAVGDIAEVQKFASLKRIAMQVNLHTNLEKKLPYWFITRVDQDSITVYPNRPRYCGFMTVFQYCFGSDYKAAESQSADASLELEVLKQKYRLKDIATLMEKQHDLLKLVLQKMEIISEAEDEDTSDLFQHTFRKKQLEHKNSKWDTVLKAVKCKST
ncbi:hypothetical protein lerEdw1_008915 [Lerista edwardsae]|nr:hypothetical protein lerEdw1_008915 [Lerista edwardsae]